MLNSKSHSLKLTKDTYNQIIISFILSVYYVYYMQKR